METKLQISNGEESSVGGTFQGPADERIVLMAHGLLGSRDEYLDTHKRIAVALSSHGVGSLRVDFRGHGASSGNLEEFSIRSQASDLSASIRWIRETYPEKKVTLLATSFGAPAAILAAISHSDVVDSVVLIAPVLDFRRTFVEPFTAWGQTKFGAKRIVEAISGGSLEIEDGYALSREVLTEIISVSIPDILQVSGVELTVFHGREDDMVPFEISYDVAQRISTVELIPLDGTEHGLTVVGDDNFTDARSLENVERVASFIGQLA